MEKKVGVKKKKSVENERIIIENNNMENEKIKVFGYNVRVE
jgi:hypothetical protein